ncbi:hypothetical protein [Photobacterium lutimaris]|uniref:hypothetical protein n=1 Tax=Photobacterium lutimaris TaxID=388278 RepID=UPI0010EEA21E|nr:hypothetical protein [Photobacterium lutimaris]TDR76028.1 hypothetical protein DFP78_10313 [Photobacterium lutimaris]
MNDSDGIELKLKKQYYIEHLVNLHWQYFNAISDDDIAEINYLDDVIAKTKELLAQLSG